MATISTSGSGFGSSAFGTFAFGVGVPAALTATPLPEAGSRFINPRTRDFEVDSNTEQLAQMPKTRQRVLLAVTTVRSSSTAIPGMGLAMPDRIGGAFETQTRFAYRSALAHLTREESPVIQIDDIKVEVYAVGKVLVTISYTDLATGEPDTVAV